MGRESKGAELARRQRVACIERIQGPLKPFNAFVRTGCPKCGMFGIQTLYCAGELSHVARVVDCSQPGQHLHRICTPECGGCNYAWIERTLDTVDEIPEDELSATDASDRTCRYGSRATPPYIVEPEVTDERDGEVPGA